MVTHVLIGTKQEIAERLAGVEGEVREAIVFVEEPTTGRIAEGADIANDLFEEMRPFMVESDDLDESRDAIYTRNGE